MKYTNEMRLAVSELSKRKPYRFTVDVMQHPDYIGLRVYEDEIMSFSVDQRVNIMEYILLVRDRLNNLGAVVYPEGVPGKPNAPIR